MPVQVMFFCYILLMLSLAQIVRLEGIRRRRGPSLKPGDLDQLAGPRIAYTPPPDHSSRALDGPRR